LDKNKYFTVSFNDVTFTGGARGRGHLYIAFSKKGPEIKCNETSIKCWVICKSMCITRIVCLKVGMDKDEMLLRRLIKQNIR
jgi:hypothetical protein